MAKAKTEKEIHTDTRTHDISTGWTKEWALSARTHSQVSLLFFRVLHEYLWVLSSRLPLFHPHNVRVVCSHVLFFALVFSRRSLSSLSRFAVCVCVRVNDGVATITLLTYYAEQFILKFTSRPMYRGVRGPAWTEILSIAYMHYMLFVESYIYLPTMWQQQGILRVDSRHRRYDKIRS